MFSKFLENNAGKFIWVAIQAGIFSGINKITSDDTFTLEEVHYYSGNTQVLLEDATIKNDSVLAWGTTLSR